VELTSCLPDHDVEVAPGVFSVGPHLLIPNFANPVLSEQEQRAIALQTKLENER